MKLCRPLISKIGSLKFPNTKKKYKEAIELAEAAYSKVKKLSLSNNELPFKISVMQVLAEIIYSLDRRQDEIILREEIVRACERCFSAKDDELIKTKIILARTLAHGDRGNEALKILRQIFETFDESDGQKYIDAAENFADALMDNDDYKAALLLYKKIIAFYEKVDDKESLCSTLGRIIMRRNLSGEEYLEEKAYFYRKYVTVMEEMGDTLSSRQLEDFADTLRKLGRDEEAEQFLESQANNSERRIKDLERRIKSFDEPDKEKLELMNDLILLLEETNRDKDAERWKEKVTEAVRAVIKRHTAEPIENFDAAISALKDFWWSVRWDYKQEAIEVKRAILFLTEKKSGVEDSEIIEAKKDLLKELVLDEDEENHKEANLLFEEIENCHRKNLPASLKGLVKTLRDHANFLETKLDDYSAAREKLTEALDLLENDSEAPVKEIFDVMEQIANVFEKEENYSEGAVRREIAWNFCQKNFLEDAPETLIALRGLIWVYNELEDYDKVELYRRKLLIIKEKNLGSSHLDVIRAKEALANTLNDSGRYDEEIKLREQIIKLYRENFSANAENKTGSWRRFIRVMESLAYCLDNAGQESEAFKLRKEIVTEQKEHLKELKENSAPDDDIISAIKNISDLLHKINDYEEEFRYRLDLVKFCFENDVKSRLIVEALENLADFYSEHEKDAELKICEQIIEDYKNYLAENQPEKIAKVQEKIDQLIQRDESEETEEQPTEIDTSESLALRRGQRVPLKKK